MKIPRRIAQTLINSLKGGVVPRVGLPYIAVGRAAEIDALLRDVDIISDGGASFRFIVGRYGSGKSFLLQTIRNYVMAKNFVVVDADLSPERRLQGTRGQGLATYKELIRNMSTKTKPEGGALSLILDRWISNVQQETALSANLSITDPGLAPLVEKKISAVIFSLNEMVHGFDFAKLLTLYYQSYVSGNDETKGKVLKWFRGEYATKSEAKQELGINIKMLLSGDGYPLDLALSPDGTQIVMSVVHLEGGVLKNKVVFYDFSEIGKNVNNRYVGGFEEEFNGKMAARVRYLNQDTVCAFSDSGLTFISVKNVIPDPEVITVEVEEDIESICSSERYAAMILDNPTGDPYRMDIYTTDGKLKKSIPFDYPYSGALIDGDQVILYNEESCMVYNIDGYKKFEGRFDFPVSLVRKGKKVFNSLIIAGSDRMQEISLR